MTEQLIDFEQTDVGRWAKWLVADIRRSPSQMCDGLAGHNLQLVDNYGRKGMTREAGVFSEIAKEACDLAEGFRRLEQ